VKRPSDEGHYHECEVEDCDWFVWCEDSCDDECQTVVYCHLHRGKEDDEPAKPARAVRKD
jgi:hypothetical protein